MLSNDVAQLYVPVVFTFGPPGSRRRPRALDESDDHQDVRRMEGGASILPIPVLSRPQHPLIGWTRSPTRRWAARGGAKELRVDPGMAHRRKRAEEGPNTPSCISSGVEVPVALSRVLVLVEWSRLAEEEFDEK